MREASSQLTMLHLAKVRLQDKGPESAVERLLQVPGLATSCRPRSVHCSAQISLLGRTEDCLLKVVTFGCVGGGAGVRGSWGSQCRAGESIAYAHASPSLCDTPYIPTPPSREICHAHTVRI